MKDKLISAEHFIKSIQLLLSRSSLGEISLQTELTVGEIATLIENEPAAFDKDEYKKSISSIIDEQHTVEFDGKAQIEHKVIQKAFNIPSEGKFQRPCSAETFKQFVFDVAVEAEQKSKEETRDRLLDLVRCFAIKPPAWRSIKERKPAGETEWYFIRLRNTAGGVKSAGELLEPMLGKRVKGGFLVAGDMYYDKDIECWSPAVLPPH